MNLNAAETFVHLKFGNFLDNPETANFSLLQQQSLILHVYIRYRRFLLQGSNFRYIHGITVIHKKH